MIQFKGQSFQNHNFNEIFWALYIEKALQYNTSRKCIVSQGLDDSNLDCSNKIEVSIKPKYDYMQFLQLMMPIDPTFSDRESNATLTDDD